MPKPAYAKRNMSAKKKTPKKASRKVAPKKKRAVKRAFR